MNNRSEEHRPDPVEEVRAAEGDAAQEAFDSRNEIREFYDGFSQRRLQGYRATGNRRIDLVVERVLTHVAEDSRVLEFGCGTGLVAEAMARRASRGRIVACDVSAENIADARRHVTADNVVFAVADILGSLPPELMEADGGYTVIVGVDVVEHIPVGQHQELFRRLGRLAAPAATVVLAFPTPAYQAYLRRNEPDELQVVDEDVHIDALAAAARAGGFEVAEYAVVDAWLRNQYAHCVLRRPLQIAGPVPPMAGWRRLLVKLGCRIAALGQRRP